MFPLVFGKKTAISTIVFVVAEYRIALVERDGALRVPAADAVEDEMPSETGARAVKGALGLDVVFAQFHDVESMRPSAKPLPVPFYIDAMDSKAGRHCQFYFVATTKDHKAAELKGDARWYGKDELDDLSLDASYKEMCKRAFEIYLDLSL